MIYVCGQGYCVVAMEREYGVDVGIEVETCEECPYQIEIPEEDINNEKTLKR